LFIQAGSQSVSQSVSQSIGQLASHYLSACFVGLSAQFVKEVVDGNGIWATVNDITLSVHVNKHTMLREFFFWLLISWDIA